MVGRTGIVAGEDEFAKMREILAWNGLQLLQKTWADDRDLSARVV